MSLIRQDQHSLFVKTGGGLFRPVVSMSDRHHKHVAPAPSQYQAGDRVKAHHIRQTSLAAVGTETWFLHGDYTAKDGTAIASDRLWCPYDPDRWLAIGIIMQAFRQAEQKEVKDKLLRIYSWLMFGIIRA